MQTINLYFKSKREIDKMAKELNVKFKEIYDPKVGVYVINGDYAPGDFGNVGAFNANSEFVFETVKKYITKLEEEYVLIKQDIASFKKNNMRQCLKKNLIYKKLNFIKNVF